MRIVIVAVALLAACGSPTQFKGDAKVKGGPDGCRAICAAWNMELAGMVAMGDYSNGCICQVPGQTGAGGAASAGVSAAAAGVVMQMERSRTVPSTGNPPAPMGPAR